MERWCSEPVTHRDSRGFVYCAHVERRKAGGVSCRKLKPSEMKGAPKTPGMMPGQTPYTPKEWAVVSSLVADAAEANVTELDEVEGIT